MCYHYPYLTWWIKNVIKYFPNVLLVKVLYQATLLTSKPQHYNQKSAGSGINLVTFPH